MWRKIGVASFGGYLVWNLFWLSHGVLPPSILLAVFGLPAPTTGCTRSLRSWLGGNVRDAVFWNAFSLPLVLLLSASAVSLAHRLVRRQPVVLPAPFACLWLLVLGGAWVTKLIQGKGSW